MADLRARLTPSGGSLSLIRHLGDFTADSRVLFIMGLAAVAAVIISFAGVLMLRLIELITNLCYFGKFSFAYVPFSQAHLGWFAVLIPIAGSLIVGLMARYGTEKIRGHGLPEAIEAILLGRSRLNMKVAVLKPLSSAIVIGTGGPFGAEGPIIMTGGAIGSLMAQRLPVSDSERKTLLVAGACAGMTIVFGTPIAAIMLALELLLFEWKPRSLLPVATACIVAAVLRTYMGLAYPLFPFTGKVTVSFLDAGSWILVGICAALLSLFLTRIVYAVEDGFHRLPIHWMWWPALGAVVVGLGGLVDPNALGLGYANIEALLRGDVGTGQGLSLLLVKTIIWAVALGSGTSGGTLAPLMIIGGAAAAAAAHLLPAAAPGFWPLLAMSATLGGTLRLPFTAIFFAVGVTGNVDAMLPLLVCGLTAHTVTVLLMRRDILTEKVARRGHHVTREWHADPFALARVKDVMVTEVQSVPGTMTLHAATSFLTQPTTRHPSFPVVDAENHVLGVLNPPTVMSWRRSGKHRKATLAELFAENRPSPVAYSDWYIEALIEQMTNANVAHMPVISHEDQKLVGYIAWKDVLRVLSKKREEENRRVKFNGKQ